MRYMNMAALAAVATVIAMPFRALAANPPKPTLTLTAPNIDLDAVRAQPLPRAIVGATVRAEAATDPKILIAALNTGFEEFKRTHAAELADIKAGKTDVVTTDKLAKINETLADLEKSIDDQAKAAAGALLAGGAAKPAPVDAEYTNLFGAYMRRGGREQEEKLAALQVGPRAAMSESSNPDGGFTTPIEWDRTVTGRLKLISPIRAESQVISISSAGFTKLFTDRSVGSGWVGETASRPATSTPQFTSLAFGLGEIYANAAASQQLLDDSEIDIEAWLTGEIKTEFSRQEGVAFLAGDGVNKPYGLLTYVTGAANAARHPWGDIKAVNSGAAAGLTTDGVVSAVYALPAMYEPNAKFYLNRSSLGAVRKLKDGQGNYIWQPTYVAGQPSTLMGRSVVDVPDMPNIAAGAIAALFGDMHETYLVIDRIGVRILRDPYTNKPYICFYVTKRVGGGVQNPDAMKAILISA